MFNPLDRSPGLIVHSERPLNAEPALGRLRQSFLTAQADFYIRTHGDVPRVDAERYRLGIGGLVAHPLELSVDDLRGGYESKTVVAALQCAGNRRADLQRIKPVSGDPWAPGAIGNAAWTGVSLAAVLRSAGCDPGEGLHVAFEGLDMAESEDGVAPYGCSIPLPKALSDDVLLAYGMNGEPLTPAHGFPLRVVVPGYAGTRSAKWVAKVRVQDGPSSAFHQAKDYKLFPPDVAKNTVDLARGCTINEMPLNAAICVPDRGDVLKAGKTTVLGYAIASDRAVARVDVSSDGGLSWRQAVIEDHGGSRWSWVLWHAELDLPAGQHDLVVRAWDAAGQTQPASPEDVWNFKGYLCAAWHRVPVTVK